MFIFYYVWGFFFYIISKSNSYIEKTFFTKNSPFIMQKRTFKFISYIEKLFLVLFYRKGFLDSSLANIYRKNDIIDYRRENFPLIYFFHLHYERFDYTLQNLKLIVKQYNFYHNSSPFLKKFLKIYKKCFFFKTNNFIKFLIIQNILINKYYNYYSNRFFFNCDNNNLIKLNFFFSIFLIRAKNKFIIYDLSKWSDWYEYCFSRNIVERYNLKTSLSKPHLNSIKRHRKEKIQRWKKIVEKYNKNYKLFFFYFSNKKNILFFKLDVFKFFKLRINRDFFKLLKNYYLIRFSDSSITKYINPGKIKNYSFLYLRKNRIFNKGRYSRNRQLYRTGVYWCLWLNIIMVYGLYFIFYRFSFNFGYLWWGVLILAYSTIFSRIIKYNFYNVFYLYKEFINFKRWVGYLIFNMSSFYRSILNLYFNEVNLFNFISKYKKSNFNFIFTNFYFYISKLLHFLLKYEKNIKFKYLWQGMKEKDNSFLRYKTVLHWIEQLCKLIIAELS